MIGHRRRVSGVFLGVLTLLVGFSCGRDRDFGEAARGEAGQAGAEAVIPTDAGTGSIVDGAAGGVAGAAASGAGGANDGGGAAGAAGAASPDDPGEDCVAGQAFRDPASGTCRDYATCPVGTFVAEPGGEQTDRVCSACETGNFSETENAAACTPWSDCEPGEHVENAPSAQQDRSCVACASGTTSTQKNQSECLPEDACQAGNRRNQGRNREHPASVHGM